MEELHASVLAHAPGHDAQVRLLNTHGEPRIWTGPVEAAFPAGRGVVLQPQSEPAITWVTEEEGTEDATLLDAEGDVTLRGVMPDGRVLYSVRSRGDTSGGSDTEEFFAVAPGSDQAVLLTTVDVAATQIVGPAFAAADQPVHARCDLSCSLWPGLADRPRDAEALYHGGGTAGGPTAAIEGLAATPDGEVVGFVELDPAGPEADGAQRPELVFLDGTSFEELARIPLPWVHSEAVGTATVSLSGDGQQVLVTLGPASPQSSAAPMVPYFVSGALEAGALARPVDFEGTLRWTAPDFANRASVVTGGEIRISADDTTYFEPPDAVVSQDWSVRLFNYGDVEHTLVSDALGIDLEAEPGEREAWWGPQEVPPGTSTFYCRIADHRQQGMEFRLEVQR